MPTADVNDTARFDQRLAALLDALDTMIDTYYREHLPGSHAAGHTPKHKASRGPKWIRITQEGPGHGSAYCFLDTAGNIYKADGWKRPARGIRGTIWDDNFSIGKGLTLHGAAYRR